LGRNRKVFNDGREFNIVKLFDEPSGLAAMLAGLGWRPDVQSAGTYFMYGTAEPS
jgi:hypothetical protein